MITYKNGQWGEDGLNNDGKDDEDFDVFRARIGFEDLADIEIGDDNGVKIEVYRSTKPSSEFLVVFNTAGNFNSVLVDTFGSMIRCVNELLPLVAPANNYGEPTLVEAIKASKSPRR